MSRKPYRSDALDKQWALTRIALLDDPQLRLIAEAPPAAPLNDLKPTERCVCIDVHTDELSPSGLNSQDGHRRRDTAGRGFAFDHQPGADAPGDA